MSETIFEMRFTGGMISPETMPLEELIDVLIYVSQCIKPVVLEQNPDLKPEDFQLSLTGVQPGSSRLGFFASLPALAAMAFQTVTVAVAEEEFDALPLRALEGLENLSKYTQKRQCDAQFYDAKHSQVRAEIRASEPLDLRRRYLEGETDLYGEITRVGGSPPAIRLRTLNGELLTGTLPNTASGKTIARMLAKRLFDGVVGLRVKAQWDMGSGKIVTFRPLDLLPYEETNVASAFEELRTAIDGRLDYIEDVVGYVNALRGVDDP